MRTHRDSCCMAETKHAAALSNLAVPPQKSAALVAARLRIARSETPGWRMLCLSPASFAGRLDLISDGKGNSAVRLEAGLDFQTIFTRSCTTGLFSAVPQKARHCSRAMLSSQELIWTDPKHAASLQGCLHPRVCHPEARCWPKDLRRCFELVRHLFGSSAKTAGSVACLAAMLLLLIGCRPSHSKHLVVGSKNFSEQVVLAELLAQHIEARLHVPVERRFYLAGSYIAHQAVLADRIDIYPEYTGTALTAILKQAPNWDANAVFNEVREQYEKRFHLTVSSPLGFNNSFAMVMR